MSMIILYSNNLCKYSISLTAGGKVYSSRVNFTRRENCGNAALWLVNAGNIYPHRVKIFSVYCFW